MMRWKIGTAAMAAALLSGVGAATAAAQCGGPMKTGMMLQRGAGSGARLVRVAAGAVSGEDQWGETVGANGLERIVGLWKVDFEDAAHGYSDKGYQTWHSDFTEFLNSGRPPSTGAVCEGVWEKVGRSTYQLNHFAMAFDDGLHFTTLAQFHERVQVDPSGNHFFGQFTITLYDAQTKKRVGGVSGIVNGERVTMETSAESQ